MGVCHRQTSHSNFNFIRMLPAIQIVINFHFDQISKENFLNKISKDVLKILLANNHLRDNIRKYRLKTLENQKKTPSKVDKTTKEIPRTISSPVKFRKTVKNSNKDLSISPKFLNLLMKQSCLNSRSPTALITKNIKVSLINKSVNVFINSNGFQPTNKNPSGVYEKINKRYKNLDFLMNKL